MFTEQLILSDEVFLAQFESQLLAKEYFNHIGHLRLAYLYLDKWDLPQAIDKTSDGIKAYAESLGVVDKFNTSITYAIVSVIHVRKQLACSTNWRNFVENNDDLARECLKVLGAYYSDGLLMTEEAKRHRIEPDKKPFLTDFT